LRQLPKLNGLERVAYVIVEESALRLGLEKTFVERARNGKVVVDVSVPELNLKRSSAPVVADGR
jgi:hypothetical protein